MLAKKPKGATERHRRGSGISGLLWMLVGAVLTLMIGVFLYLSPVFNFDPANPQHADESPRQVQPKVTTDTDNANYEFYDVLPNQEMATIPDGAVVVEEVTEVPQIFEPDVVVEQEIESGMHTNNDNFGISEENILQPQAVQGETSDDNIVIRTENHTYDGADVIEPTKSNHHTSNDVADTADQLPQDNLPPISYILQINSFSDADEADRRRAQVLMAGVDARVVKKLTANNQPLYQVVSQAMTSRQAVLNAQQRLQNNGIDSLIVEQHR